MKLGRGLLVIAALAPLGCGGGGSSPGATGDPLVQGKAALNLMVTGKNPATAQSLQSVLNQFNAAVQQNPGSAEAQFGAAVCLAGVVAQEIDGPGIPGTGGGGQGSSGVGTIEGGHTGGLPGSNGGMGSSGSGVATVPPTIGGAVASTAVVPPAPPGYTGSVGPLPPQHTLGLFWNLNSELANPLTLLLMLAPVADLQAGLLPFGGYAGDDSDVARRQQMLSELNTVTTELQQIEANAGFTTTLADPAGGSQPLTVGLPEVHLFGAFVDSLRVELSLSLAYRRDTGTSVPAPLPGIETVELQGGAATGSPAEPPTQVTSPFLTMDKNHDGKLTPNEYLPPSPYLTLRDASYLKTAQQALAAAATEEIAGITGVFARPSGPSGYFVSNTASNHAALVLIQSSVVPIVQQAAVGPVTLQIPELVGAVTPVTAVPGANTGSRHIAGRSRDVFVGPMIGPGGGSAPLPPVVVSSEPVVIDLAAWFASPPEDLKVFAPTYTLNSSGWPDPAKTVYPDPTFGGLFPKGLPPNLLF